MGLNLKKWLKNATRIRIDNHTGGNLLRNAGLVAGAAVGGVPGALIAGGTSAARAAARPGANLGDILKAGVGDAAIPMAVNAVLPGQSLSAMNTADVAGGAGGGAAAGGLSSSLAKSAPFALSALGDVNGLLDKGLGVAALANAADLQRQSTDYAKGAYDTATTSYGERAPLRVAGIAGLLNPKTADLASLKKIQSQGNPFAAPMAVGA